MARASGFTFTSTADGHVVITHRGTVAGRLSGAVGERFLNDAQTQDPQLLMARLTGNYKRGNERAARQHPRNRGG